MRTISRVATITGILIFCAAMLAAQQTIPPFQTTFGNFTNGFELNGSYGTSGQCPVSTGTGVAWGSCGGSGGGLTYTSPTLGYIPKVSNATSPGTLANSHFDEGVTTTGWDTTSIPFASIQSTTGAANYSFASYYGPQPSLSPVGMCSTADIHNVYQLSGAAFFGNTDVTQIQNDGAAFYVCYNGTDAGLSVNDYYTGGGQIAQFYAPAMIGGGSAYDTFANFQLGAGPGNGLNMNFWYLYNTGGSGNNYAGLSVWGGSNFDEAISIDVQDHVYINSIVGAVYHNASTVNNEAMCGGGTASTGYGAGWLTTGVCLAAGIETNGSSGQAWGMTSGSTQGWITVGGGGGMTWPSSAGIANYSGSSSWSTSYTVGNSGTDIPQLSSGLLAASILPLATTSAFGAVKPDGSTITISAGVISAAGGGAGCTGSTANGACYNDAGTATYSTDVLIDYSSTPVTLSASNSGEGLLVATNSLTASYIPLASFLAPDMGTNQSSCVNIGNLDGSNEAASWCFKDTGSFYNNFYLAFYGANTVLTATGAGAITTMNNTLDDSSGNAALKTLTVNGGSNVVYRCTTAGTLAVGALTVSSADCTASSATSLTLN